MEKTIKTFNTDMTDFLYFNSQELRNMRKGGIIYWHRDPTMSERIPIFCSNLDFEKLKRNEDSKMIRTNYDLNKENVTSGELSSSGPWADPDKVKAIRETIEAVMKNHNTTDIREIDLDMLSSCINATINREKLYYDWLNEFTSDEVDEYTIKFAIEFLDWVIRNKIDEHSSLYFKN